MVNIQICESEVNVQKTSKIICNFLNVLVSLLLFCLYIHTSRVHFSKTQNVHLQLVFSTTTPIHKQTQEIITF